MQRFGGFLILMGAGSMVLHLISFNFVLMSWADLWDPTIGWVIRGAILALGIILVGAAGLGGQSKSPAS
jgi:hypothetical protein